MPIVKLKAVPGNIVYIPISNLPFPARREVIEVRMRKSRQPTYALQNNRTGEIEFFDDIDFGRTVFLTSEEAETALKNA